MSTAAPATVSPFAQRARRRRLEEALSRLLRDDPGQGRLIVQVVVEGGDPAVVAAERAVSRPVLVEQLREAVGALAYHYELVAYGSVGETKQERMLAMLGGKRR
jgi:hypothetical protein